MSRSIVYGALGGVFAGPLMGIGTFIFSDRSWMSGGRVEIILSPFGAILLILPFALLGMLLGGSCAYVVDFGCREMRRFAPARAHGFRSHHKLILWLTVFGALTAVLLPGGLPLPPGLFPSYEDVPPGIDEPERSADPWQAIEMLQMQALEGREDRFAERLQLRLTRGFFAYLSTIQAIALLVLGATITGWFALVCAIHGSSRRAGREAVFWSFWLLAGGYFIGIACISGFGHLYRTLGPDTPGEILVYSIWNTGIPAAWTTFVAAAANTIFGLFGLPTLWRSVLAGLVTAANTTALLVLGTTSRWTSILGLEVPMGVRINASYFEGALTHPYFGLLPAAPMATLGIAIGVALSLGGACYGMNVTSAEQRDTAASTVRERDGLGRS